MNNGSEDRTLLIEEEIWELWRNGQSRCPFCIGASERDFEAMCDCSRYSWEKYGMPLVIGVVGTDIAVTVPPAKYEEGDAT